LQFLLALILICVLPAGCARPAASAVMPLAQSEPAGRPGSEDRDAGITAARLEPIEDLDGSPYSKRLDFLHGDPAVPVRLMEGRAEVVFTAPGRIRIQIAGAVPKLVEGARGARWTVRIAASEPAKTSFRIVLGEISFADKSGLEAERAVWKERGIAVGVRTIGTVYGIRGQVIDNRRYLIILDEAIEVGSVAKRQAEIDGEFGIHTRTVEDVERKPSGSLELLDNEGNVVAISEDRLTAEPIEGTGFAVSQVEFGVGYESHGFEDRSFRGSLEVTVDRRGKLAVVNLVSLEDLLKGLVPAEMFARAPTEALKAQAVTARGEVLAKVGTRHIGDPYLLCSEQHCAVYKGRSGEAESTSLAVEATRGEALFSSDHRLVDSVYSAVCGGHTEDNDAVWGGLANANLRGKPDLLSVQSGLPSPGDLNAFLSTEAPAACRLATLAQPGKFRWERRLTGEEVDRLTAPLHLGSIRSIAVIERGVSGRARSIQLSGTTGSTQIRGELNIRRLFGMLNSSMFIVEEARSADGARRAFNFRGGGWGHGVGMCQLGAIGRAEAGQDYRAILRHYFSGAEVVRLY
jgi:SpoIID/LytB domain protein